VSSISLGEDKTCQELTLSKFPRILESKRFREARVVCGDKEWSVDKLILYLRNPWLKMVFKGPFWEPNTGKLRVYKCDEWDVDNLLKVFHLGGRRCSENSDPSLRPV
jgi:hypothetical protein